MTATTATLAGARRLYVAAGLSAFLAMLANVVDMVLGFGGEMVTYGAKPAAEWFDVFQRSPFEGLYALGILNIVYMLGMLPVYVGLLVVHRHTHPVSAGFTLLLSVLATGIYISSNAAVPMLELAQQHAVATTDAQRWALVGAGEAVLARGEDFTPGTFVGLFLSGLAAIVVSIVMLRGRVFSRINAWAGIAGFSFLTLFTFVATFVQAWYVVTLYLFGGAGGLLALAWFAMTGRRFLTLEA